MSDYMWLALLGHLVGDYLLQTKAMNLVKGEMNFRGFKYCTIHVLIYTVCVLAFWQTTDPLVALAVFVPHWVIDKWSLASPWLRLIKGRTFMEAFNSKDKYREFDVAFTSIVYKEVDFTLHLLSLWVVVNWMLV